MCVCNISRSTARSPGAALSRLASEFSRFECLNIIFRFGTLHPPWTARSAYPRPPPVLLDLPFSPHSSSEDTGSGTHALRGGDGEEEEEKVDEEEEEGPLGGRIVAACSAAPTGPDRVACSDWRPRTTQSGLKPPWDMFPAFKIACSRQLGAPVLPPFTVVGHLYAVCPSWLVMYASRLVATMTVLSIAGGL